MIIFEDRIKELYDMLDLSSQGFHTSKEIAIFRDKYFEHLKEVSLFSRLEHLEPYIDQYKYLLYHANKNFRHDNDWETKRFLDEASRIGHEIIRVHLIFPSYGYMR